MNKELERLIFKEAYEFAEGSVGICDKLQDIVDDTGEYPIWDNLPCQKCQKPCEFFREASVYSVGMKHAIYIFGNAIMEKIACKILKEKE